MFRLITFLLLSISLAASAQVTDKELVQFSGVVVTSDSLKPIPFVSILIKNTSRGTVSDYYGFFSFVAKMKDTVEFTAIGYKKATFRVPDTITDNRCSLIQILLGDTVMLKEALIYPWPTKEAFKEAFLSLRVPDDDLERAKQNLDRDKMTYLAENMAMDGNMNFRNQMLNQQSRIYYAGQVPTSNWLNPIAWARFIEAWQSGAYKKRDKKGEEK
jgi:hypothetical protein